VTELAIYIYSVTLSSSLIIWILSYKNTFST